MVEQHTNPKSMMRVRQPYQGAYRNELETDDPATQTDPAATQTDPTATQTDPVNLEESTYKNRYDSLKTHYDRQIVDARRRETELKAQLAKASMTNMAMPKSPQELEQWGRQYPDLYGIVRTAIMTELKGTETAMTERLAHLELDTKISKRASAEATLERLHPDFPHLRNDPKFHEWVKTQPSVIQTWLYDNEDDPLLAARAIDLYKNDVGPRQTQTKTKQNLNDAALAVNTKTKVADTEGAAGKEWKVSDIQRMNRKEYDQFEEEIDKARREGRLIIDV